MVDQALTPANSHGLIDPRARPMLPVGKQAAMALELVGLPTVLEMVLAGHAQTAIAAKLGISQASLGGWLANLRGADAALYSEALRASAEAMIDQAQTVIEAAEPTTPSVMKARAVADLLVKKAGIRNRAYRERIDSGVALVDMGEPAQAPTFLLVIHPEGSRGRTFEHEAE